MAIYVDTADITATLAKITALLTALQTSVSQLSTTAAGVVGTQNQQTTRLAAIKSELDAVKTDADAIQPDYAAIMQALAAIGTSLQRLVAVPSHGKFNPPPALVKFLPMEVVMSVLQLEVGQTAVGTLSFSEPTPPADGAVTSDNSAVTVSLASDMITWTCVAASVTAANTPANITYTGTSVAPDVGPAQVAPMAVTVIPVPAAETGDFNPAGATITGP